MYPYEIILGMTLYDILLAVGVVAALVAFRLLSDRDNLDTRLYNFTLLTTVTAVILGYCAAVFTQAIYDWIENGIFVISKNTGATFLGGLVGGAFVFIVMYFGIGHFIFKQKENIRYFPRLLDIASVSITAAHGFGRIGCLMAGCCHGNITDAWYGIYHVGIGQKVVPVQLFEAIVLFTLCALLAIMCCKGKIGAMAVYMSSYGVWRFFAEFLRADDRGSTVVDFLSPSQLTSLILIIGSVFVLLYSLYSKKKEQAINITEKAENNEE